MGIQLREVGIPEKSFAVSLGWGIGNRSRTEGDDFSHLLT